MPFNFHHDAGHGWLKVTRADLEALALLPRDFSRYSYRAAHNDTARPDRGADVFYLEEDCDAMRFVNAWCKINGRDEQAFAPCEVYDGYNSFIRNLPRIY